MLHTATQPVMGFSLDSISPFVVMALVRNTSKHVRTCLSLYRAIHIHIINIRIDGSKTLKHISQWGFNLHFLFFSLLDYVKLVNYP